MLRGLKKIIKDNHDELQALQKALAKYETLDGKEVEMILQGKTLTRPTVGDLLETALIVVGFIRATMAMAGAARPMDPSTEEQIVARRAPESRAIAL